MGDQGKPGGKDEGADETEKAAKKEELPQGPSLTRREFATAVGVGTAAAATLGRGSRASAAPAPTRPPLTSASVLRIHPAIGVARLGNCDPNDAYFIGPEIPGQPPLGDFADAVPDYKKNGQIKPQGARFRVWQYEMIGGRLTPVGEVNLDTPGVKAINWQAQLANRKASFYEEDGPHGETLPAGALRNPTVTGSARQNLESDFGPRTIAGRSATGVVFSPTTGGTYPVRWVRGADGKAVIDYLGQLRTDGAGRLIVLGGKGKSASSLSPAQPLTHWSNNNFWFDDISDGPVTATVTIAGAGKGGKDLVLPMDTAGTAWVLVAPPDFSPHIGAAVSLYDMLYDMAVRTLPIPANNALYDPGQPLDRLHQLHDRWMKDVPSGFEFGSFTPDYLTEIWPIVLNAVNYVYTTALVNFKHGAMMTDPLGDNSASAAKARGVFFGYIRPPEDAGASTSGPATMPRMYGDNWYVGNMNFHYTFGQDGVGNPGGGGMGNTGSRGLPKYQRFNTLTPTQYGLLRAWNSGNFVPVSGTPSTEPGPSPGAAGITPHGLDRAALENCIGGPFYPGIECSWQMRNPNLFIEPFRLNPAAVSQYLDPTSTAEGTTIGPGHFSRQMALPWHADFNDCSKLLNLGWWPSARPDDVFLNTTDKLNDRVPWARADAGKFPSGGTGATYEDMVANWYKFGFILDAGFGFYIEKERNPSVP